ncbi:hypothetical protein ACHAXM_003292 [Skeletonema potamos]
MGNAAGDLKVPNNEHVLLETGRPYAKIHSTSWGSRTATVYDSRARRFDQFMFENDDMLIVVAAGNDGHDDAPKTIDSPGLGKNVLTVGSHLSFKTSLFGGHHGGQLSDLSSRGPTVDGRTKPDIISVGEYLLSAGARPDIVGECDPSDGSIPRVTTTNDGLASKRGTSMATPVVSGTAAIVRQYFEEGYYPTGVRNESNSHDPTGALIKAVLLNGAQNLYFVDNSKHTEIKPHDNNQGFGRMSLQDSVYIPGSTNVQLSVWDKEFIRNGETREFDVVIDETGGCKAGQLSATLVWLEPASVSGCKRCVLNDLDLTVVIGNTTYFPNALDSPDRINNAERIIVHGVTDGTNVTISVKAYNLVNESQKFSLVTTGCFGGVANQLFYGKCSVFECPPDDSDSLPIILMGVFIPLGVILICVGVGGCFLWRRQRQKRRREGSDEASPPPQSPRESDGK